MSYTIFSDINDRSRNIRIKARVVRIWEFTNISNPDDIYSLEFLMLDEKVRLIFFKIIFVTLFYIYIYIYINF